ncbi:methionyl-tRNA formyltransferase [Spiroplasma endosymbiont of Polydrusus pterygomalis]|uniref:methionyl-tRNA formyltransferase n=1 Tax=Spiroplasma endosymbiont of Polydrusus pterygomalis TaxID=3139327 RepID=UPI003CCB4BFD
MKKIKILFMGSSFFSENILKTLLTTMKNEIKVVAVVCQPDRKIGRKQDIVVLPIKQLAKAHNITIFQPEKIIDSLNDLQLLNIDVILTCAYGQFLPKAILNLPKNKCLNIHASLLPQLRGGAPIQWAIINGLVTTGITLMKMISKMDAGAIYLQGKVAISNDDTYTSLVNKLIILAQDMLIKNLLKIINNEIKEQEQDENKVTFGLNIKRSDEKINWNLSAQLISCHVRGLYNKPIAYTTLNNNIYKIHQVAISEQISDPLPGTIVAINKLGIIVATKTNNIIIKVIQPAGKKEIIAACYYGSKSNPIKVGLIFE